MVLPSGLTLPADCAPRLGLAKYTVRVSMHHCGQTFSAYLGGWEGRSPVRTPQIFFDDFLSILGNKILVLKDRILE